ncbi:HARBI1 [Mytilus coruscus]|uniref:Putative nuclease HARBI1 n=1 Tax=Mytilus coruscus TaxID=42192 RepID=A0A6J8A1W2_MYTCO|nr:HARBI1 [Mytilus coruscus]
MVTLRFLATGSFLQVVGDTIGAIDGTHVRIQAPSEDEPSFVNRKGVHSVNVQAVCDVRGKFTNINANWPGSSHDSHIFRTSQVFYQIYMEQNGTNGGWADGVLLGDSGYPCRPFLMTPYQNPVQDHQKKYNRCHCSTRSVIERTFGRLKRRFHILHSEVKHKKQINSLNK